MLDLMSLELKTFQFNKTRMTVSILVIELLSAYALFTTQLAGAEVESAKQQVATALEGKSRNERTVLEMIEQFLEKKWGVVCLWPAFIEKGAPFPHIISLREEMMFAVQFFCLHP